MVSSTKNLSRILTAISLHEVGVWLAWLPLLAEVQNRMSGSPALAISWISALFLASRLPRLISSPFLGKWLDRTQRPLAFTFAGGLLTAALFLSLAIGIERQIAPSTILLLVGARSFAQGLIDVSRPTLCRRWLPTQGFDRAYGAIVLAPHIVFGLASAVGLLLSVKLSLPWLLALGAFSVLSGLMVLAALSRSEAAAPITATKVDKKFSGQDGFETYFPLLIGRALLGFWFGSLPFLFNLQYSFAPTAGNGPNVPYAAYHWGIALGVLLAALPAQRLDRAVNANYLPWSAGALLAVLPILSFAHSIASIVILNTLSVLIQFKIFRHLNVQLSVQIDPKNLGRVQGYMISAEVLCATISHACFSAGFPALGAFPTYTVFATVSAVVLAGIAVAARLGQQNGRPRVAS